MYFVDQTMRAVALTSMYSDRYIAQMHARWLGPVAEADTQPLPVSPDGQLVAGEFYASSVDPSIHYALPQYQVHVADGRYQASLRWIANPAVRSDPIGVLTIDLAGPLPSAPGFSVQEIAHTAIVRLRYRQPLDDRTRPRGMPAELFAGEWRNTDRATRGMTRLVIERVDATTVSFHGYGACQPEDCDWGVVQAQVRGDRAMGIYDFGWKQTRIVVSRTGAQLIAEVIDDYTEADGRQDRSATYTLETRAAEQALPPFAYELGALNPIGPALRRCEMPIYERADFDRIYQIMTEQRFGGMLELRCFATVGHRSWRQVVTSGSFDWLRRPLAQSIAQPSVPATRPISAASTVISQPNIPIFRSIFRRHEGGTLGEGVDAVSPTIFQVLPLALPPETSAELFADTAAMTLDGSTAPLQQAQLATAMLPLLANVAHIAQPMAVNTAVLISAGSQTSSAVAMPVSALLKRSDMRIRRGTEIRIAIPVGAIADQGGEAALLAVAVESAQTVAPFCFVRDTNAYMFVLPGGFTPETKDSLLADAYTHSDGRTVRYYRDEGRKLFYYQPSEFLLARTARPSASAAYQPYLLATMQNIITTGEGQGDAVTDTQVTLTYQLLPSLDPELRELTVADIERKYGETPRLLPIYPGSATVTFGDLPGVPPQTLQADFANGIAGEIELSEDQFKLVMALLTARPDKTAGALSGTVRTTLLDNTPVEVPLRISLVETAGPLFDVLISGLVEGTTDTYQVGLRNRVENPIALNALKQVSVGNQMAYPQAFAPALIGPGQTADVAYKIAPAGEPLRAIDPQLNAQVLIDDYKLLWRKLVVQQGFTSEKFTITVAIQGPEYFASSPDGVAMLTSVLVEFDSGATATLTAEAQSATVELSRGYLAVLIGDFSTYRFRTAANYNTGVIATTEWIATDLDTLAIVPALPAA